MASSSSSPSSGVELKESQGNMIAGAGVALDFRVKDPPAPCWPAKIPRRLRRRLSECRSTTMTADEIDAKLKEADLRRQQFYEFLSHKARPRQRSPSRSSLQEVELSQRLEAKLNAAEQKRMSILAKAQMRLAKLDEQRQAAKSSLESRFEKERGELGMKVESRVQQAEANRMLILKTYRQRRAARSERSAQSLMRRMIQESKYKECVRAAIHQKRMAAERKRLGILEAERSRARARFIRVQRAASSVHTQKEIERMKMKNQLEDRLQRARRQRAEYLRQRKSLHCSTHANGKMSDEQAEILAKKLARCWRRFVKSRGTTYLLVKAYEALNISEKSVKSMPFEQLALKIESDATLRAVKSLLDRLESRLAAQKANNSSSGMENMDHLLRHVASPKRRRKTNPSSRSRGAKRGASGGEVTQSRRKLSRYAVRVVLCAYMILGHPDAVLSGKGEHETCLAEAAAKFIQEFELLIKIISEGPREKSTLKDNGVTFRSQLEAFDKSWCHYLYRFVVWKVNDARLLEEDLVRAACQLELSMMHTCKLGPEGDSSGLTHDMKAIQKQVMEDQTLLKEKVQNLSGDAGIERMESALSDVRSKFFALKEVGSPMSSPVAHISSSSYSGSSDGSPVQISDEMGVQACGTERSSRVARLLFKEDKTSQSKEDGPSGSLASSGDGQLHYSVLATENELLVNEIVHGRGLGFADNLDISDEDQNALKTKVKETMEKAFWDGIMESMKRPNPDFSWVLKLMTEVRDELCEMSPSSWRQEIVDTIDIDLLSQVLRTDTFDMNYLGKIMDFALVTLQKLSAPANDDKMQASHQNLLRELRELSQSGNDSNNSFVMAVINGLRYVLQQIQTLKKEISKARIRMIEPLIKGPSGLEYLQKAFSNRYGPPSDACASLPLTKEWLSSIKTSAEHEWGEHVDSLSALPSASASHPHGLPCTTLRTGGSVSATSRMHLATPTAKGKDQPECKGDKVDLYVRLGLLKLVNEIEGITPEGLPETMKLNFSRLRALQSQLQKIIVISTSMLILRRALLSERLVTTPSDIGAIISQSSQELSDLLENVEDVGIPEITEAILPPHNDPNRPINPEKLQPTKAVVANTLAKSLKSGDPVFTHVSRAIYLAARSAVLGGTGSRGGQLAEGALRRVGAAFMVEKVVEVAEVVVVVATVSGSVHGEWYEELLKNM